MSRKDYELLASVIRNLRNPLCEFDQSTVDWAEKYLSSKLQEDNAAFDPVKFRKACEWKQT